MKFFVRGRWTTLVGQVLLTLGVLGVLLVPVLFNSLDSDTGNVADDAVRVSSYTADYTVDADGAMGVSETIVADFPAYESRHGIFRFLDTLVPSEPNARLAYEDFSVTLDGGPVAVDYSWESGRYYVMRIGDPNIYVEPGMAHTYQISYRVPGATFDPGAGGGEFATVAGQAPTDPTSAFYWDVVPTGLAMPVDQATITVNLPESASQAKCSAGTATGPGPCLITGAGTDTVTFSAANLPAASGMTVSMPLAEVPPSADTLPWPGSLDPILGGNVFVVAFVALLTVAAGVAGALLGRRTKETAPGLPVMYAPPSGLGPVQCEYIVTEEVGDHALLASILRAAEQGLVRLSTQGKTWTIEGIAAMDAWQQADPPTAAVATSLGLHQPGASVVIDKSVVSGQRLVAAQSALVSATNFWAEDIGAIERDRTSTIARVGLLAAIAFAFVGMLWIFSASMWVLPFAAFAIGGFALLATGSGSRRTALGRRLWSEAGGFKRMISTPSSEQRFDFAARTNNLYAAYLPYAVAFGAGDAWADKYRTEMNTEPPVPTWYPVSVGATSAGLFRSGKDPFKGFEKSLSSSIGAYQATQRSSSSSRSGGFGGGGGGGGGGSW